MGVRIERVNLEFKKRVQNHLNRTIQSFDEKRQENPQFVAEYTKEILQHYLAQERVNQPKSKNMKHQPFITDRMRSILIDWIIEVHQQLRKLKTESLFLTINIIDRFLEK
jgi:hypothetical protein